MKSAVARPAPKWHKLVYFFAVGEALTCRNVLTGIFFRSVIEPVRERGTCLHFYKFEVCKLHTM